MACELIPVSELGGNGISFGNVMIKWKRCIPQSTCYKNFERVMHIKICTLKNKYSQRFASMHRTTFFGFSKELSQAPL